LSFWFGVVGLPPSPFLLVPPRRAFLGFFPLCWFLLVGTAEIPPPLGAVLQMAAPPPNANGSPTWPELGPNPPPDPALLRPCPSWVLVKGQWGAKTLGVLCFSSCVRLSMTSFRKSRPPSRIAWLPPSPPVGSALLGFCSSSRFWCPYILMGRGFYGAGPANGTLSFTCEMPHRFRAPAIPPPRPPFLYFF